MSRLAPVDPGGNRTSRDVGRCRLRTHCDGATTGLQLRRIHDRNSVRIMLCCDTCADGQTA